MSKDRSNYHKSRAMKTDYLNSINSLQYFSSPGTFDSHYEIPENRKSEQKSTLEKLPEIKAVLNPDFKKLMNE